MTALKEEVQIQWPFFRYKILLPQEKTVDAFEWFYLSLIEYQNRTDGKPAINYDAVVKDEVCRIVTKQFSDIIDEQTLEKVIINAEADFVQESELNPRTAAFLESYDTLLSEKMMCRYVFQDGITGEVLPLFYEGEELQLLKEEEKQKDPAEKVWLNPDRRFGDNRHPVRPSPAAIRKAYVRYSKLSKFDDDSPSVTVESDEDDEELQDPDRAVYLDDIQIAVTKESNEEKTQQPKNLARYNVIYIGDRTECHYLVKATPEESGVEAEGPFGSETSNWMRSCVRKGRGSCKMLDDLLRSIDQPRVKESEKAVFIEGKENGIYSGIKCGKILQQVDHFNSPAMNDVIRHMDGCYSNKDRRFFEECGKLLELILNTVSYPRTDSSEREKWEYSLFRACIDARCSLTHIDGHRLRSEGTFKDWQRDKTPCRDHFKARLADVCINTSFCNSSLMTRDSINEILEIYDNRNAVTHQNKIDELPRIDEDYLSKMERAVELLCIIDKGENE